MILSQMKNIPYQRVKSFEIGLFFALSSLYIVLNSKNLLGSYSLFMDEKLIFDGVIRILQPTDFHSLLFAITDGGDQRYGRLLWNLIALFSYLPYKIWGAQGVIFTERLFGGVVIVLAIMILARIFSRNKISYSTIVLVIVLLPFTTYYATTPKPEPLILIFLALYILKSKSFESMFGRQWIYLGIIVGVKISGMFILLAIVSFIYMQSFVSKEKHKKNNYQLSLAYFCIGFSIAVPTLYAFAVFGAAILLVSKLSFNKLQLWIAYLTSTTLTFVALIKSEQAVKNYFAWTIGSSRHGSDSELINYRSWFEYIFEVYFQSQISILVILILAILFAGYKTVGKITDKYFELVLPFFLGIATILPITLYVDRLWGFYLWCGSIFLAITIHNIIVRANFNRKEYFILFLICVGAFTFERVNPIQFSQTEMRNTFTIESSPSFKLQNLRYKKILNILSSESSLHGKVSTVAFDPLLWIPESTEIYEIKPFWGPYTEWETPTDFLVFTDVHTPAGTLSQDRNLLAREREIVGYKRYVVSKRSECGQRYCYYVAHEFDGIVILKLHTYDTSS